MLNWTASTPSNAKNTLQNDWKLSDCKLKAFEVISAGVSTLTQLYSKYKDILINAKIPSKINMILKFDFCDIDHVISIKYYIKIVWNIT